MNVQRFGFDRVFRFPAAPGEKPPRDDGALLQRIAVLEAELEQAKAEYTTELSRARRDGFSAGLAQARAEREAALLSATDAVQAALEDMGGQLAAVEDRMTRDMAALSFTAADILAGHEVSRAPGRALDEALGRALDQIARGTPLGIRVHPDLVADMEERLRVRRCSERRRLDITIIGDPALAPGDGTIFWEEGGLAVDAVARREAVLGELGPLLLPENEGKVTASAPDDGRQ